MFVTALIKFSVLRICLYCAEIILRQILLLLHLGLTFEDIIRRGRNRPIKA
jgi:hypothetical protein